MMTVMTKVTLTVKRKKPITFWTRFQNFEETNKIAIKHSFLAILIQMNQLTFMYYSVYSSIACKSGVK